jgi:hypothetical protein
LFSTPPSPAPPTPTPPAREGHAEFALEQLRINPDLTFADLRLRGTLAGLSLHYATYARARKLLALPPLGRPRGRRLKKDSAAEQPPALITSAPDEANLRARAPRTADENRLGPAMDELRQIYGERDRFREVLLRMREIVDAALHGD